jgi:hypothetical protein
MWYCLILDLPLTGLLAKTNAKVQHNPEETKIFQGFLFHSCLFNISTLLIYRALRILEDVATIKNYLTVQKEGKAWSYVM